MFPPDRCVTFIRQRLQGNERRPPPRYLIVELSTGAPPLGRESSGIHFPFQGAFFHSVQVKLNPNFGPIFPVPQFQPESMRG